MTIELMLSVLRSAGFRHVVTAEGDLHDHGLQRGVNMDYRMWHPLLERPNVANQGSAYVGVDKAGQPYITANGVVRECFTKTLGVAPSAGPHGGAASETPRWYGEELGKLLGAVARLR